MYLKELRYSQTDTIIMAVDELLTHIFATYGLVDATKISKEEKIVSLVFWNLINPPFIVYNAVEC